MVISGWFGRIAHRQKYAAKGCGRGEPSQGVHILLLQGVVLACFVGILSPGEAVIIESHNYVAYFLIAF